MSIIICFQHDVNGTSDVRFGRVQRDRLPHLRADRVALLVPVLPLLRRPRQRRHAVRLQAAFPGDDRHEHST